MAARSRLTSIAGLCGLAGALLLLLARLPGIFQPGPALTALGPVLLLISSVGIAVVFARRVPATGRVGLALVVAGSLGSAIGHAFLAADAWAAPAVALLVLGGTLLFTGLLLFGASASRASGLRAPAWISLASGVAGYAWFVLLRVYPPELAPDYYLLAREVFSLGWLALSWSLAFPGAWPTGPATGAASAE